MSNVRNRVFTSAVFLALAIAMLSVARAADEKSSLLGVWRFQGEVDTRADGSVATVGPAEGYSGLLVYTADGYVSVNIMPKERKWKADSANLPQLRETVETGTAYFGRFEVDPKEHTVTHIVEVGLEPSDEGRRLVRKYELRDDDTLVLSASWQYQGQSLDFAVTWKRVK
jgi:Lipocalin-like domain